MPGRTPSEFERETGISFGKMFKLGFSIVLGITALVFVLNTFFLLDSRKIAVVQYPNGQLVVFKSPGPIPKWLGHVQFYNKQSQYWFSKKSDQGGKANEAIKVRFNDGGHADMSGSVSWSMPMDEKSVIDLHVRYGSQEGIEQRLVRTVVEKSVYMTGPLMSSRESYNERRNELIRDIEDQIQHGVYRTSTVEAKAPDPITGETKSIQLVKITADENGNLARQEQSPLERFGIQTFNLSINSLDYEETVEKQIRQQQEMTMGVQTAIAEARKSEQAAITAAKNGEAQAAKAKWDQEVIKAKEVTLAQQHLAVNTLEAQAAEMHKRQLILEGGGEGEKKRLAMAANGALEQKLATWLEAQKVWATAFQNFQGQLVPGVVMGGGGNAAPASGATNFMELMSVKAARDLLLDMSLPSGASTKKVATK